MGAPAVPTSHPANQKAALWTAGGGGGGGDHSQAQQTNHPYLYYSSVDKPNTTTSPMECILHKFNSWSKKAEITSHNIWNHLKTGPSVSGAAWDKVNLTDIHVAFCSDLSPIRHCTLRPRVLELLQGNDKQIEPMP
ncbi:hypothetical protein TEA_001266 [Camellia sinensis var. sinensis]|uniref:Uncharacterized protein n=1 Tax=Camellia sinensis var. sinensis TaxID=542762 RepID=A0A4S4EBL3_CAMSN|nr:hypothetical protein TEA_003976 [Camellia sinensis var. sinensis]THG13599.1 hypothetical protein TEA_001266 [Camellia sinensis var. sinensis]